MAAVVHLEVRKEVVKVNVTRQGRSTSESKATTSYFANVGAKIWKRKKQLTPKCSHILLPNKQHIKVKHPLDYALLTDTTKAVPVQ